MAYHFLWKDEVDLLRDAVAKANERSESLNDTMEVMHMHPGIKKERDVDHSSDPELTSRSTNKSLSNQRYWENKLAEAQKVAYYEKDT